MSELEEMLDSGETFTGSEFYDVSKKTCIQDAGYHFSCEDEVTFYNLMANILVNPSLENIKIANNFWVKTMANEIQQRKRDRMIR